MQSDFILPIAAVVLGAILGSFLNALSYRFNTGRGMGGRSYCDTCGHTLSPLDLVPVFSFIFLGGRCRYCSARISVQNPLVEVAAAALSLMVYLAHPDPLAYALWLVVWMTLLFVVVYDLRHTIIPWSCSILLAILTFAALFVSSSWFSVHFAIPSVWALAAGPLLAAPLTLLSLVSRGRWMGWGDGALEVSLGWMLGLSMGATALMLAFWIGAAVGIILMTLKKGLTMKSELPFAPFLVLGALVAYFFHVDFFSSVAFLFQG
ncbi:MAG TPA: prepilin peptidase [Candidatus Paceibacterota bacterium]|nr:prepilin peptidase [Candidatus Paceibacterota bacterium]